MVEKDLLKKNALLYRKLTESDQVREWRNSIKYEEMRKMKSYERRGCDEEKIFD